MAIVLGPHRYGKAEVRMVHVDRSSPVHVIKDVTVTSQLFGDFTDTHVTGSNAAVIATDTQKNTVYALARTGGISSIEEFALRMARHFVEGHEQVSGARQEIEEYSWGRIATSADGPHDHSFVRAGTETRTAVVTRHGDTETVISGLADLTVLKSTGSEFWGFPEVEYTSLRETTDRVLATEVTARWRHLGSGADLDGVDWDKSFTGVRQTMLDHFAGTHSYSMQQTLYAMGRAVLESHPELAEIRFSMPNKHHFLVDLSAWGLDNPNEVWFAADRPYGLIEAAVVRDDVPADEAAWAGMAGFV
jgi:urate oxidase